MDLITLNELEIEKNNISFENFNIVSEFKKSIGSVQLFFNNTQKFINQKLSDDSVEITDYKKLNSLSNILNRVPYSELRKIEFASPVGLKTNLLDYSNFLIKSSVSSNKVYVNTLIPYKAWLLRNLGNPDFLKTREETTNIVKLIFKSTLYNDIKLLKEEYPKHINVMSVQAYSPYEKLVSRNKDWNFISDNLSSINLKENKANQKNLLKIVGEITELHNKFLKYFNSNVEYKPSQEILKAFSESIYQISEEVEFFALTQYRLKEYFVTIDAIVKRLETNYK